MNVGDLKEPEAFEPNPFYERLLFLRETNKKAFDSISPASKLALLRYEALKREHESLESELPPAA